MDKGSAVLHLETALATIKYATLQGEDLRDGGRSFGYADDFNNVRRYLREAGDIAVFDGGTDTSIRFRVARQADHGVWEVGLRDLPENLRDAIKKQLDHQRGLDAAAPGAAARGAAKEKVKAALAWEDAQLERYSGANDLSAELIEMGEKFGIRPDIAPNDPADPLRYVVPMPDGSEQKFSSADFDAVSQARLLGLVAHFEEWDGDAATFGSAEQRQRGHGAIGYGVAGQPPMDIAPVRPNGRRPDMTPPTLGGRMKATPDGKDAWLLRWNFEKNGTTLKPAYRWEPKDFRLSVLNAPTEKSTKALFDLGREKNLFADGAVTITGSEQFQIQAVEEAQRRNLTIANAEELCPQAQEIIEAARKKEQQATIEQQNAITSGFMAAAATRSAPTPQPEAGGPDAPEDDDDSDDRDANAPRRTAGRMR